MARKGASRKLVKKKTSKLKAGKSTEKLNAILIENFVNLQKALTNLSVKFDKLSDQISSLLQLFEISAKSFAEKLGKPAGIEKDREFLEKIDKLVEQNKLIAKGLTLMEEKIRERVYGEGPVARPAPPRAAPAVARPRFQPRALPAPPSVPPTTTLAIPSKAESKEKTREIEE